MARARKKTKPRRTAAASDKWDLYERSVQGPKETAAFVDRIFSDAGRPPPRRLREDFCGTARNAIEWVRRAPDHEAVGVDLDPECLERARHHVARRLKPEARDRIRLVQGNVLTVDAGPMDVVMAQNFSHYVIRSRKLLLRYFRRVRKQLTPNGLFLLDAYGGSDAHLEIEEPRKVEDFTYVWHQQKYDPVTGRVQNAIHFRFRDGSKLENAFVYDWRMWSLPELTDALRDAGFKDVKTYLEPIDEKTGEGTGTWEPAEHGEAVQGWSANLVAIP